MLRLRKRLACAALLAGVMALPAYATTSDAGKAQASSPQPATTAKPTSNTPVATDPVTPHKTRAHRKKAVAVAEVPQTPPPPPTLEQQPPAAPRVSYRNGLLTIDAPNSTLSSILRAVQQQTGASMDIPGGAGSERVAMALGPGQPRDVLNSLLNGSKFDYVILGVAGQPGAVQKVILTPRLPGGTNTTQAASAPPPEAAQDESEDNVPVADTGGESEYPGQEPNQAPVPPGGFRRPMGAPGAQQYQQYQQNPFPPGESNNVVKTPEQLMQELQQMQQQQEQYQEQLNPANRNPEQ